MSIRLSTDGLSFWSSVVADDNADVIGQPTGAVVSETAHREIVFDRRLPIGQHLEKNLTPLVNDKNSKFSRVNLYIDSHKSILVPCDVAESEEPKQLFESYGLEPGEDEILLITKNVSGTVALVAFPEDIFNAFSKIVTDHLIFSPLQHGLQRIYGSLGKGKNPNYISMHLCPGRVYISAFESGKDSTSMTFCDHFTCAGQPDILYYLSKVSALIDTGHDVPVLLSGHRAKETKKFLRKYYKENGMRIIGGTHKGRIIPAPKNLRARPTTDFAKENLFNVLNNILEFGELDVLDLFAGTGSIGFEFASRGAKSVTSVEINTIHYNHIKQTAKQFGFDNLFAVKANSFLYLKSTSKRFDVIFSDAPYDLTGSEKIIDIIFEKKILKDDGMLIFEHSGTHDFNKYPKFWQSRKYGSVYFTIFKNKSE